MTFVKLVLKLASWIALAVGLVWSGKLSLADEGAPPLPVIESSESLLGGKELLKLSIKRTGESELAIAIGDLSDSQLLKSDLLLEEFRNDYQGATLDVSVTAPKKNAPEIWSIPVASLQLKSGGNVLKDDNSFLILAKKTFAFNDVGACDLSASFKSKDGAPLSEPFEDMNFYLLAGSQEDEIAYKGPLDTRPGLVLLAGLFGAFYHLFVVLIYWVVPLKDPIPDLS